MIVHIALFAWKPGVSAREIEEAVGDVRALKNRVRGLIDIRCGENFSKWNDGFTHAFVVTAEDQAALDAYRAHPDHKKVAARLDAMESKSIGFDFADPAAGTGH